MSYQSDRAWSDRWIPEIRRLVGPFLLVPSSFEVDTKQAADLVVLTGRDLTVACRIRRAGYAEQFPDQFTIRAVRGSGATTELEKVVNGFGDWLFYGHECGESIAPWMLINLAHFRAHLIRNRRVLRHGTTANGDGTSFAWFDASSFPPDPPLILARGGIAPLASSAVV